MTTPVPTPVSPVVAFKIGRPVGYSWSGALENFTAWDNLSAGKSQLDIYAGSMRSKVSDKWVFSLAAVA